MSLAYLRNIIRDPNIASITPTSRFGVARVCDKIDFPNTKVIVEYGPATGVFTKFFLENLNADGKVFAFETNANFLRVLTERITDPRLQVFLESAELSKTRLNELGIEHADYVVSGIPFTFLPPEVAHRIIENTRALLRPGGKFLIYQFLKKETENNRGIHRYLPSHFDKITREAEWLNIPPLWVYSATK